MPREALVRLASCLLLAGGLGCAAARDAAPRPAPAAPSLDLATAELVDLTWTLDETTLFWPTSPSGFGLEVLSEGRTPGGWYYAANAFCMPEHGGTHLDAPLHFGEGRQATDEIPLRRLVAPAVVLDVAARAAADPDLLLSAADVLGWEAEHGRIAAGSIVLLRTGWSARWPDRARYFGSDLPGDASDLHFPSFGPEAAELLVGERRVAALGVDTASIDGGQSQDFRVHRIAAAAEVPGLENLTALERLPPTGAWVAALPVKIGGGSGGPVRVVAFVPR